MRLQVPAAPRAPGYHHDGRDIFVTRDSDILDCRVALLKRYAITVMGPVAAAGQIGRRLGPAMGN